MRIQVSPFQQVLIGTFTIFVLVSFMCCSSLKPNIENGLIINKDSIWFEYEAIIGIGYEKGIVRRDPSDIIKVGDNYYVWYTRNFTITNGKKTPGYNGRIGYATSTDGYSWIDKGEILGPGEEGSFDSHAVFTPNILAYGDKYYLYYTGVKPTPGNPDKAFDNNSETDITAIGLAVSDSPDGPFERISNDPVLETSGVPEDFDSYRIDDAALLVKGGEIWLYYKGRSRIHGESGPLHTQMGVAFADKPEGPFKKFENPLLDKSHEVLIWNQDGGISALASINKSIWFAPDGLDFSLIRGSLQQIPKAPGLFRPHLADHSIKKISGWGISQGNKDGDVNFLQKFTIKSTRH